MKAVICAGYGPPEVLQLKEVAKPTPRDDEVLIKVRATTVHIGDVRIRSFDVPRLQWLLARMILGLTKPKDSILGLDLAGDVEAVGRMVTRFKPGDAVFATTFNAHFGAYAEYKCLSEDGLIALKPAKMTYGEAAALANGAPTALIVLRKGHVQRGQQVLIYGASGSVGTFAVQLARHFGADVTGVCSTANLDLVQSLGAARVMDYTKEDFTLSGAAYDIIFDAVGKLPPAHGKKALKPNGIYLNVNRDSGSMGTVPITAEHLTFLKDLVEQGKLRTVIDRCYPLGQIVEAHRYVEKGHKKGNVVISLEQSA